MICASAPNWTTVFPPHDSLLSHHEAYPYRPAAAPWHDAVMRLPQIDRKRTCIICHRMERSRQPFVPSVSIDAMPQRPPAVDMDIQT